MNTKRRFTLVLFGILLYFHYLCFVNIGCGLAKKDKKLRVSFLFAFTFHYFCLANLITKSIMEIDNKNGKSPQDAGRYLVIGISLGVAFGIIFDNLAVWLCLGVGIGLLAPQFLKKKNEGGDKV